MAGLRVLLRACPARAYLKRLALLLCLVHLIVDSHELPPKYHADIRTALTHIHALNLLNFHLLAALACLCCGHGLREGILGIEHPTALSHAARSLAYNYLHRGPYGCAGSHS